MNDFSIDDILSEIETKKNKTPQKNSEKSLSFSETTGSEALESLTEELEAIEKKRFGDKKDIPEAGVTQILEGLLDNPDFARVPQIPTAEIKDKHADFNKSLINTQEAASAEPAKVEKADKPVKIQRFTKAAETPDKPVSVTRQKTRKTRDTRELPKKHITLDVGDDAADLPKTKPDADKETKVEKVSELLPEEKARLQKLREEELLRRDIDLEDPHELIDGLNPYDVKNIEAPSKHTISEIKVTLDLEDEDRDEETDDGPFLVENADLSGDEPDESGLDENGVKEYGGKEKSKSRVKPKSEKEKRSSTALLESLNKKLASKRESDINARRTLTVDTVSSLNRPGGIKERETPLKLNIDYKKKIIEDSAVLPLSNPFTGEIEAKDLAVKKKRKIRDFILEDVEDEYEEDDIAEEEEENDEYDGYDTSGQIWEDLTESHKGLKWRFSILMILTLFLGVVTLLNDTGVGIGLSVFNFRIFDKNFETTAYLYLNLLCGLGGLAVCAGVIRRGLSGFFMGKGDCDTMCAIPSVIAVGTVIAQISNPSFIQLGKAHIYVSAALFTLLFNTIGKILMIVRAKRNFRFISGDNAKYYAHIADGEKAGMFTKGLLTEMPVPVFMRKTEFLTDFLKNSYCNDMADLISRRLTYISVIAAIVAGIAAYFIPPATVDEVMNPLYRNIFWALTAATSLLTVLSPISIMFIVNNPLLRASKSLSKSDSVVMGYNAAHKFSKVNAVVLDAGLLFPAGSIRFAGVKRCQKPGAITTVTVDESIVIAASLAIKANSILSYMFYDIISGDDDLLYKIDNCIYEVNMGITGWLGPKRAMLGNREQMKHHGIEVPHERKERKHCPENGDVVYLAVGGETVAMFFVEVLPNPAIKSGLKELLRNNVALAVKTKDSLVTVNKLADIFELAPEKIRILPFDLHESFDACGRYTSRGSSAVAVNGTFTSFAKALIAAKTLMRDITVSAAALFLSVFLAAVTGLIFVLFAMPEALTATNLTLYNAVWFVIILVLQALRRY